ncbi:hypothetical protein SARC_13587, partial [Sphaeroforma arctica JP610]
MVEAVQALHSVPSSATPRHESAGTPTRSISPELYLLRKVLVYGNLDLAHDDIQATYALRAFVSALLAETHVAGLAAEAVQLQYETLEGLYTQQGAMTPLDDTTLHPVTELELCIGAVQQVISVLADIVFSATAFMVHNGAANAYRSFNARFIACVQRSHDFHRSLSTPRDEDIHMYTTPNPPAQAQAPSQATGPAERAHPTATHDHAALATLISACVLLLCDARGVIRQAFTDGMHLGTLSAESQGMSDHAGAPVVDDEGSFKALIKALRLVHVRARVSPADLHAVMGLMSTCVLSSRRFYAIASVNDTLLRSDEMEVQEECIVVLSQLVASMSEVVQSATTEITCAIQVC